MGASTTSYIHKLMNHHPGTCITEEYFLHHITYYTPGNIANLDHLLHTDLYTLEIVQL